ncbi:MAG: DUF2721 domain-containing protein [Sphingomicrobium sp.]
MLPEITASSATQIAHIIQLAVAPIFLLAGVGAFLNVCAGRLARIIDRARDIEPMILQSRGEEHDRWLGEIRILDKRMALVSQAIFFAVLAAVLTCLVVIVLFAASLTNAQFGTTVALLFIGSMVAVGISFSIFLFETRLGSRSVRIRTDILEHEADRE